jgi:hypothetical protein
LNLSCPAQAGTGVDVFVDGARGLPDNCGATKVSLRLVAAGATVGVEHSGVCDAGGPRFAPTFRPVPKPTAGLGGPDQT